MYGQSDVTTQRLNSKSLAVDKLTICICIFFSNTSPLYFWNCTDALYIPRVNLKRLPLRPAIIQTYYSAMIYNKLSADNYHTPTPSSK